MLTAAASSATPTAARRGNSRLFRPGQRSAAGGRDHQVPLPRQVADLPDRFTSEITALYYVEKDLILMNDLEFSEAVKK